MEFVLNHNNLALVCTLMNRGYTIAIAGVIAVIAIAVIIFSITAGMSNKTIPIEKTANRVTDIQATEIDETYRWESTESKINPTLNFVANADNVIEIKNPTDEKHEFVIESYGKEVAASGDVEPDGSAKFSFKPVTAGTYEYHCEYHPTTMKGTIEVTNT